jgi:hypothetical protein
VTVRNFEMSEWTDTRHAVTRLAEVALGAFPGMDVVRFLGPKTREARVAVTWESGFSEAVDLSLPKTCSVSRERFEVFRAIELRPHRIVARIYDAENGDTFFLSDSGFVFVEVLR